ncbi:unnamed protein product [Protopolystoma xenopodis]|uniref:Uncharacterized protein n=1 Tax=Protopolystoma xenopodis TaxID=117903 RepID=A0A3S5AJ12_9PLAT|nr:unnamed protein product [Protopolystoma xenopodis]
MDGWQEAFRGGLSGCEQSSQRLGLGRTASSSTLRSGRSYSLLIVRPAPPAHQPPLTYRTIRKRSQVSATVDRWTDVCGLRQGDVVLTTDARVSGTRTCPVRRIGGLETAGWPGGDTDKAADRLPD